MARAPIVIFIDDFYKCRSLEIESKEMVVNIKAIHTGIAKDNAILVQLNKDSLKDLVSILENSLHKMEK